MSDSDKTAVAAHLYVTMRRVANRVIDVEWMSKNEEYAREILNLARQQGAEDLTHYADLYEGLMFVRSAAGYAPVAAAPAAVAPKPVVAPEPLPKPRYDEPSDDDDGGSPPPSRYVGSLR